MADQEGNVFLTLLKDKVLWLLLRPVMLLSTLVKKQIPNPRSVRGSSWRLCRDRRRQCTAARPASG